MSTCTMQKEVSFLVAPKLLDKRATCYERVASMLLPKWCWICVFDVDKKYHLKRLKNCTAPWNHPHACIFKIFHTSLCVHEMAGIPAPFSHLFMDTVTETIKSINKNLELFKCANDKSARCRTRSKCLWAPVISIALFGLSSRALFSRHSLSRL